jgi:hypothetical protein
VVERLIWVIAEYLNCRPLAFFQQMETTMTEPGFTNREDPNLQADPVLSLSDDRRATFGQKLFWGAAAIVVVLSVLYGLVH